jgi:Squalene-hopene cyclase C-terminal domain/Prenyltransferase and squalene oxidase repeat
VGVKLLALAAVSLLLAGAGPVADSTRYLESRQAAGGGFAEPGRPPDPSRTAWTALALRAGGGSPQALARASAYLAEAESGLRTPTELALNVLARSALDERPAAAIERLRARPPGRLVNETIWTILALRQAGEPAPPELVRALQSAQRPSGGWSWTRGGAPDSNDTAAALQALRAAGVSGRPVERGLAYLRAQQNRDGGWGLAHGRPSDAQSTAWAIQGFLAAGRRPGAAAWRYLSRLRRPDGSYRYSARYATTPVWVTAQVLPALAGTPFPLKPAG